MNKLTPKPVSVLWFPSWVVKAAASIETGHGIVMPEAEGEQGVRASCCLVSVKEDCSDMGLSQ